MEGVWKTAVDDGDYALVTIAPCGANLCGKASKTFKDGGEFISPNIGKTIAIDMVPKGGGKYKGKVWHPPNDKTYIGKMALSGAMVTLSGCVAGGLICSKQIWNRVK